MRGDGIEDDSDVAASGFDQVVARAPLPAGPRFSDAQAEAHMANRDAALALEHRFQERYAAGVASAEAAAESLAWIWRSDSWNALPMAATICCWAVWGMGPPAAPRGTAGGR